MSCLCRTRDQIFLLQIRFQPLATIRWDFLISISFVGLLSIFLLYLFHIHPIFCIHPSNPQIILLNYQTIMAQQGYDNSSFDDDNQAMVTTTMHEEWQRIQGKKVTKAKHGGTSSSQKRIPRDRVSGHELLMRHYFANPPMYPTVHFRSIEILTHVKLL